MADLSPTELIRYSRHILLSEIGLEGQQKLRAAKILIIGAGGLGSPAALYLAAAGVGTLGLADFDRVELHNLQRQIVHGHASVGIEKTASAIARLRAHNPDVHYQAHSEGITAENALEIFRPYDVIIDGTDNFSTRYLNNDAAVLARRPLVYGSVFRFTGQVTVMAPHLGGPCHRCLFPEPPPPGSVPSCGEAGVVGALCGVIGALQALEAVKLIAGFGEPLLGRLLTYDALTPRFQTLRVPRDPGCAACGAAPSIRSLDATRYSPSCSPTPSSMADDPYPLELSVTDAKQLLENHPQDVHLIDVRESFEVSICRLPGAEHIPMRQIPENVTRLPRDRHLLIHCHHGGRSLRVTEYLRAQGFTRVSNVAGGIDAWAEQIDPSLRRY
jgi:sulfur-carrier protein adenylyltransferase/sulfurtransferase